MQFMKDIPQQIFGLLLELARFFVITILTQCGNLGKDKPHSMPTFHAFTGCDSTYLFLGKKKKSISMGSLEFLP